MSAWIVPPHGAIEPCPAQEFYVDGIAGIELVSGGCVRVYLFSEQMPLESGGAGEQKIISVKIVGPLVNVPTVIGQLAQCLIPSAKELIGGRGPRLVK